jgi:UDP:flavonoid glycosyltransferase YjiC (YdhE family)
VRILFTSVSAIGHVNPILPLALALRDRGHDIRWATGPDARGRLESAGINAVPVGVPWENHRSEYWRRYPEARDMPPAEAPEHTFPRLFGAIVAPTALQGVIDAARSWRPNLVVHDAAEFAGAIAAAQVGVPSVTHGFGALSPISRVRATGEFVAPLWRSAGLEPRPFGGSYDYLYLDIYPRSLQAADMSHVPFRQALRPVAFDDLGDVEHGGDVSPDERRDRPLVYLTFGTIARDPAPLRTALDAIASLDVRVLVTVGPIGDPEALGRQPGHVRVERYVAQSRVFRDCAVVASHAGSGTFLGALSRGIPQLCLPQAADQFLNAAACRRAGVGIALEPAEATRDAITEAVASLLAEPSFRARASEVASEIAAMPGPEAVAAVLEQIAL